MIRSLYFALLPHPVVLTLPVVAAFWLVQRFSPRAERTELRLWQGTLILAALLYAVLAAAYYTSCTFLDHVEPQVASTAAALLHGGSIYHLPDGERAYALGYGPLLYWLVEAAYRCFGPHLLAAKLTTLFASAVSLASLAVVLHRGGARPGWWLATLLAAALVPFGAVVWLRADPLLLTCAALGWLVAETAPPRTAQLLLALLMAAAASLKLHGPVYLLPPLLLLWRRDGWAWTLVSLALGAAGALAPFAAWERFGRAYAATLQINAGHGLSLSHWLTNLEFAAFFSAPLWLSRPFRRTEAGETGAETGATLGLATALLLVSVIASKPGAGHWHFLPLLPSVMLLAARRDPAPTPHGARLAALGGWAVAALFLGVTRHDQWIARLWRDPARAQIAEVRAVLAAHPQASVVMGAGENAYGPGYSATFVRPELVLHGQPYRFDPAAIMDLRKAHYPPERCASPALWGPGPLPLVLIPRGEAPFALNNFYGGATFPEPFREDFLRRFARREAGEHFEVWAPQP